MGFKHKFRSQMFVGKPIVVPHVSLDNEFIEIAFFSNNCILINHYISVFHTKNSAFQIFSKSQQYDIHRIKNWTRKDFVNMVSENRKAWDYTSLSDVSEFLKIY